MNRVTNTKALRRGVLTAAAAAALLIAGAGVAGASTGAALRLLRRIGANVVAIGTLVTEASVWRSSLGDDADMVQSLGAIPVFRPDGSGNVVEDWAG